MLKTFYISRWTTEWVQRATHAPGWYQAEYMIFDCGKNRFQKKKEISEISGATKGGAKGAIAPPLRVKKLKVLLHSHEFNTQSAENLSLFS